MLRTSRVTLSLMLAFAALFTTKAALADEFPGASGMAHLGAGRYLCVQDVKAGGSGSPFGLLTVADGATDYAPALLDWPEDLDPPSDLEALSAVDNRPGEFLACESGYWQGKYGRILHVALDDSASPPTVSYIGRIALPELPGEVEGIGMRTSAAGRSVIVLGVRGGTPAYSPGLLYWYWLDLSEHTLTQSPENTWTQEVYWPHSSSNPGARAISDLFIDSRGGIWVSGAEDMGDNGPFRSVVWGGGTLMPETDYPLNFYMQRQLSWEIAGVKIEALAAASTDGAALSYATDDENYGGIWRPLPPALPPQQQQPAYPMG